MKFSVLTVLGLLGLASAQNHLRTTTTFAEQQAAIRAAVSTPSSSSSGTALINTSVVVEGVKAASATEADQDVITQAVVAAYRQVYKTAEDGMLGACGGWGCGGVGLGWNHWFNFKWFFYMISWDCDFCPNDDDIYRLTASDEDDDERTVFALASFHVASVPDEVSVNSDWSLHRKWERTVCHNLRASGSEALQGARGCAVSFYDLDPTQQVCDDADAQERQETLIKIEGVALEEDDADKIEAAAQAAGLQDFDLEMVSTTSAKDNPKEALLGSIVLASFAPGGGCSSGVSAVDVAAKFCAHLKALGMDAAHDCELAQFGNHYFFGGDGAAHPKTTE